MQAWLDESRLNVVKGLGSTDDGARLQDLQERFLTALFPALEKLRAFAAAATPSEQELMVDPGRERRCVSDLESVGGIDPRVGGGT